jgi:hypothetical protein
VGERPYSVHLLGAAEAGQGRMAMRPCPPGLLLSTHWGSAILLDKYRNASILKRLPWLDLPDLLGSLNATEGLPVREEAGGQRDLYFLLTEQRRSYELATCHVE